MHLVIQVKSHEVGCLLLFVLREEHQVVVAVSIAYGSRSGLFQFRASSPFVVGVAEGMEREVCLVGGFRDAEGACRIVALFTISIFINKSNP